MKQKYIIKNKQSFNPIHIFECGQCFRWNKQEDGSYIGIVRNNVLKVEEKENNIIITGNCEEDIKKICEDYFSLDEDYEKIKENLSKIDDNLKTSIKFGEGIRILHQDLWETIISFIISANNNIPRIKGIIERISKKYGKKIIFEEKEYYTFPTAKELSKATVEDLRNLGLGFRDVRVFETTRKIHIKEVDLEELKKEKDICKIEEELLSLPGVGPKVADCIMLFSLKKYQVFPIDVWVRRVMSELYFENKEQKPQKIKEFVKNYYGERAGLAQQYLFYWRREL
jgi:N-glycosylase/DNA lyase